MSVLSVLCLCFRCYACYSIYVFSKPGRWYKYYYYQYYHCVGGVHLCHVKLLKVLWGVSTRTFHLRMSNLQLCCCYRDLITWQDTWIIALPRAIEWQWPSAINWSCFLLLNNFPITFSYQAQWYVMDDNMWRYIQSITSPSVWTPVAPFTNLTLILAWISNYIHYKECDEITYPFLNFNGATVEV